MPFLPPPLAGRPSKISHKPQIESIAGVILAGGKSRRFGRNKALVDWHGRPLIAHVVETITSLFSTCLLVTNTPEIYEFLEIPMVGDLLPGAGPLAGIQAALHHIEQPQAFVVGCDMPRLDREFIRWQSGLAQEEPGWDVLLPWLEVGPEPLHALYRKSCLPIIEKSLEDGERRVGAVLGKLQVYRLAQDEILAQGGDLGMFSNINRLEDMTALDGKT